jgi:hypothetical protein
MGKCRKQTVDHQEYIPASKINNINLIHNITALTFSLFDYDMTSYRHRQSLRSQCIRGHIVNNLSLCTVIIHFYELISTHRRTEGL